LIIVIDNYDSFTYNLVQCLGNLGAKLQVLRNDQFTFDEIQELQPKGIVISPGPGNPNNAGHSLAVLEHYSDSLPILGVCLGHQCIGQYFGGKVTRAKQSVHGKTSPIIHNSSNLYEGISNPFFATRYHSLIVDESSIPSELEITAYTEDGVIMGLRHKTRPVEGVQFHPESVLTPDGPRLLQNFLKRVSGL
jgi:anthranilate synthase/aminodeoxychorismate synthase-like glutamine amidotransferase